MNQTDAAGNRTGPWEEPDPHGGTVAGEYVQGLREGRWVHRFADGRVYRAFCCGWFRPVRFLCR